MAAEAEKTGDAGVRWWPPMLALSALLALLAGWIIRTGFDHQRLQAGLRLQALAELRDTQVEAWIVRQMALARFLSDGVGLAQWFARWQDTGDQAAGARLLARADDYRKANDADSVRLLRADGAALAQEPDAPAEPVGAELRAAVAEALASGQPQHTDIVRAGGAAAAPELDVVVPLRNRGPSSSGAMVLRFDPRRVLFPMLARWPLPSPSGETLLWSRDGDQVLAQSPLRHGDDAEARLRLPWRVSALPVARALRGEVALGDAMRARDYRGIDVLATVRPISASRWWLEAKLDMREVDGPAWANAGWTVAAALLVLFGAGVAWRLNLLKAARLRVERERDEQRERLRALSLLEAIAQSSSDAIFAKDLQGHYVLYNRAACEEIGRTREQVLGRTDAEVFGPAAAAPLVGNDRRVLDAAQPRVFEELIPTLQGERVKLCTKGPLRDADGRLIGVFGVSRDVTDNRRAERALRDSEAHYRSVVAVLNEGVLVIDPQGAVLSCNPAAERLVGSRQQDWQGRQIIAPGWQVLGPDGTPLPPEKTPPGRVLAGAGPVRAELLQTRDPAGELRWFEISSLPVLSPDDGQVLAVVSSFWDVTDRKRQADELTRHRLELEQRVTERTAELKRANAELELARDRAEAANRAKSAFLANMSHEIRTPMNAIIGLTHLMSRESSDAQQSDRLNKVDSAAQHLLRVVNDILDLSKIEAGKLTLEHTEFALDALLARCFEMVSARARDKGLELVVDTGQLPARLTGDPTRLSQALINLLSNAVKFTDSGWVRLRCELLGADAQGLHVRFEVRDTGVGIAADRQALLFTAFEQADASTTRRHGGTGLGLALTGHLARLMAGDFGVSSEPGAGSVFWFTARLGRAGDAAPRPDPVAMRGLRGLLVDDLPEARTVLADRLQLLGVDVDAVPDGPAAVRQVEATMTQGRPYDILLIDWQMTPLDGAQTLQRLREVLGDGMPPSLLVTAFDDAAIRQQAQAAGFGAVLVKPITASALHDAVIGVLRRRPAEPADPPRGGLAEALLRSRHAGQRVLLAEDNPVNQEVAGELLRAVGLGVDTADDGARAVELALSRRFDLVLMDVQMPVMDGLSATRSLRQRGLATPVIAMTAHAFGEDRAACIAAGMNDHVAKPVDPEQLYAALLRWLPPAAGDPAEAAAAAASSLPDRLATVSGFDPAVGLRNLGGQAAPLQRVLASFVGKYRDGEPALAGGDPARWRAAAHSLRGACGTVGAMALHERLRAFELQLDADADAATLAAQARALNDELLTLAAGLAAALAPEPRLK